MTTFRSIDDRSWRDIVEMCVAVLVELVGQSW